MKKTTNKDSEQTPNSSELTEGEKFWKRLKEMPYNSSRAGQYFVFTLSSRPIGYEERTKKEDAKKAK